MSDVFMLYDILDLPDLRLMNLVWPREELSIGKLKYGNFETKNDGLLIPNVKLNLKFDFIFISNFMWSVIYKDKKLFLSKLSNLDLILGLTKKQCIETLYENGVKLSELPS